MKRLISAALAVLGIFLVAAVCALTIGIPVPFAGWMRGPEAAMKSPMVVIFYGIIIAFLALLAMARASSGGAFITSQVPASVHGLIDALRDKQAAVRVNAVRALGERGQEAKAAVPALLEALKDRDKYVRRCAAEALKTIDPDHNLD